MLYKLLGMRNVDLFMPIVAVYEVGKLGYAGSYIKCFVDNRIYSLMENVRLFYEEN